MPESLTFNNRQVLENSSALKSGGLFLYLRGTDLRGAFELLIEPENTARILYTQLNGDMVLFDGYTKLTAVRDEGNGLITAVLEKGETD